MRHLSVASVHVGVEYWAPMFLTLYPREKRLLNPHCTRKVHEKTGGYQRCGESNCIQLPAVHVSKKYTFATALSSTHEVSA